MSSRIVLNDLMKIVCGLYTDGTSVVDGVDVLKTCFYFPSSVYISLCILSDWFYF